MSCSVVAIESCDTGNQWIIGVRHGKQCRDREKDAVNGQCRGPLVLEDVKADGALGVHVGVVHLCLEGDLGGLERVVWRKVDVDEEDAVLVWAVRGSHDGSLPVEQVIAHGTGGA